MYIIQFSNVSQKNSPLELVSPFLLALEEAALQREDPVEEVEHHEAEGEDDAGLDVHPDGDLLAGHGVELVHKAVVRMV